MDTLTEIPKKSTESEIALKVAIQGYPGAFHDIASRHYFEDKKIEIVPGHTFDDLVDLIKNKTADIGLMAIENTLAGGIMSNYYRLLKTTSRPLGKFTSASSKTSWLYRTRIEELIEAYSHPMAIAQCKKFFHPYHIRLIEAEDTALSAKMIANGKMEKTGAIASSLAADMYGLEMIAESIETNKQNYTVFSIRTGRRTTHQRGCR
ncbi:MAG: prephenate dehydratase domain-containing protein [Saprospiraceae bacterium]